MSFASNGSRSPVAARNGLGRIRTPDRIPPHDLGAERALLGAMLLSPDAIDAALEHISADVLYTPAHAAIFGAIATLHTESGARVDPVVVADLLHSRGQLEMVGGVVELVMLQTAAPSTTNAGRYAQTIRNHATLRRLIAVGGELAELGYSLPEDVGTVLERAEQLVYNLRQSDGSLPAPRIFSEVLADTLDLLEARFEKTTPAGVPTGYVELDKLLGGLRPGTFTVIGARPSHGKSAFALGVALYATLAGHPTLFCSLEMGDLELGERALASEARVDLVRIRDGSFVESDWPKISQAVGHMSPLPLWMDDNAALSMADLRFHARRIKRKHGLALVIVDYLQLLSYATRDKPHSDANRQQEVARISQGLKRLSTDLAVPVIALSQLSRSLESRHDKRPQLGDLRESGSLEQDAHVVIGIYRDQLYNPQTQDRGIAEILVLKNRSGPTGTPRLAFLEQYTRFANMANGG